MRLATTSLPVPVSPRTSTVVSCLATRGTISSKTALIAGPTATMSLGSATRSSSSWSCLLSPCERRAMAATRPSTST